MRKKIVAPRSSLIFPLAELLVELAEDGFPPIDEERDDDEDDGFLLLVDIGIVATSARGT